MKTELLDRIADLGMRLDAPKLRTARTYDSFISRIRDADLDELASLHRTLSAGRKPIVLAEWIMKARLKRARTARFQHIWYCVLLIEVLGERGASPFATPIVGRWEPCEPIDWTSMPLEFAYLIGPASKYGDIMFGDQIDVFGALISRVERATLKAIAARSQEDVHDIVGWMREVVDRNRGKNVSDPALNRVDFFLKLLYELGMT